MTTSRARRGLAALVGRARRGRLALADSVRLGCPAETCGEASDLYWARGVIAWHASVKVTGTVIIVFRYFWILLAGVMLLNITIWRKRLEPLIDRGTVTKVEVDRFVKWAGVWLVGGPIIAGLIGLAAGWSTPFCAGIFSFDDVPRTLLSTLTLMSWLALLWWVWRGNGADFLARVGPALTQRSVAARQFSPTIVRLAVTAFVLVSGLGGAIAWRTMPRMPEFECPALPTIT